MVEQSGFPVGPAVRRETTGSRPFERAGEAVAERVDLRFRDDQRRAEGDDGADGADDESFASRPIFDALAFPPSRT